MTPAEAVAAVQRGRELYLERLSFRTGEPTGTCGHCQGVWPCPTLLALVGGVS